MNLKLFYPPEFSRSTTVNHILFKNKVPLIKISLYGVNDMTFVSSYMSASENKHLKWPLLHLLQEPEQTLGNSGQK